MSAAEWHQLAESLIVGLELVRGLPFVVTTEGASCRQVLGAWLASLLAGSIFVPLGSRFTATQIASVAARLGVDDVVAAAGFAAHPNTEKWVSPTTQKGFRPLDCPVSIIYTSGTTGEPKGVECGADSISVPTAYSQKRVFQAFELDSISAQAMFGFALGGATLVTTLHLTPTSFERVSGAVLDAAFVTPAMIATLHWGARSLPLATNVGIVYVTGSRPSTATWSQLSELLPGARRMIDYSLTEADHVSLVAEYDPDRPTAVGHIDGSVEVRIVDDYGGEVPVGKRGILQLKNRDGSGPRRRYAPGQGPRKRTFLDDGWIATGDRGLIDDDGFVHVLGRSGDVIVVGGRDVDPSEVEDAALRSVGIFDAVAVGINDALFGQTVGLCVVALDADSVSGLRDSLPEVLAPFATPTRIIRIDKVPRNPAGKPVRLTLARKFF